MNAEIKRKWTAALRSGEYEQGNKALRTQDGFCCLGVLCDLHRELHPERQWERRDHRWFYGLEDKFVPHEVQAWAGLEWLDPYVTVPGGKTTLSTLNDGGSTFKEIAAIIEDQL